MLVSLDVPELRVGGGKCNDVATHEERTKRVAQLLLKSEWFERKKGHDHFIVTSWWRGTDIYNNDDALNEQVFKNMLIGFIEVGENVVEPDMRYIFQVPYVENVYSKAAVEELLKQQRRQQATSSSSGLGGAAAAAAQLLEPVKKYNFSFRGGRGQVNGLESQSLCETGLPIRNCLEVRRCKLTLA